LQWRGVWAGVGGSGFRGASGGGGGIALRVARRTARPRHPLNFVWIVSRGRCWTADQLERHRLPHSTAYPLCDQSPKTLQHLLLGCVVAQEIWVWTLNLWDRMPWLPPANVEILHWWTSRPCPKATQRDLWTSIILLFWCIWRHRNDVVFNGARPNVEDIRAGVREKYGSWRLARLSITNAIIIPPRHTAEPMSNASSVDGRTSELLDPWLQALQSEDLDHFESSLLSR
jgi:hypothetical protein